MSDTFLTTLAPAVGQIFDTPAGKRQFFSFQDIETLVLQHRQAVSEAGYDYIVAVARGGLYAATMLSQFTGIELMVSHYSRKDRLVRSLLGAAPPTGGKVLVVEDVAGRGFTLVNTVAHFERLGWTCDTFTLVWDDLSRIEPTYGLRLRGTQPAWPWERSVATQLFSIERQVVDPDHWIQGFDLDGVFLPDVPAELYTHDLEAALQQRQEMQPYPYVPANWYATGQALIVSARLVSEQSQTESWLRQHGVCCAGVFLRPHLGIPSAQHKARTILEQGICEFVESELDQAQEIARLAPHCVVWHYDAGHGPESAQLTRIS